MGRTGKYGLGAALAALVIVASSCGDPNFCDGQTSSGEAEAPAIENFGLVDQLDGDPWTAIFSATFKDSDGDLGGGSAKFYINGKEAASIDLHEVFQQSDLGQDAVEGIVALPLRFSDTIDDETTANLGLQLIDVGAHSSNCYGLELEFNVSPID